MEHDLPAATRSTLAELGFEHRGADRYYQPEENIVLDIGLVNSTFVVIPNLVYVRRVQTENEMFPYGTTQFSGAVSERLLSYLRNVSVSVDAILRRKRLRALLD